MGFKGWIDEKQAQSQRRHEQRAEAWYSRLTIGSALSHVTESNGSLELTGGLLIPDQETRAIVAALNANLAATLLVAKRLDRVVELLEQRAGGSGTGAPR